jgi:SAM-dependent methyltransferase
MSSQNISFYNRFASSYHLFFRDLEESMQQEGNWLEAILRPAGVRTVLDAGCGTGRQSIPLAKRGFAVIAADPSGPMLEIARAEAARRRLHVDFLQCGFVDLPACAGHRFDAVISMGNSLCNLESPLHVKDALGALHACCVPGGTCILGMKDFDRVRQERRRIHTHRVVDTPAGTQVLIELWTYDDPVLVSTAFVLTESRTRGDWKADVAATHEYMLGRQELWTLAHGAGFATCEPVPHRCEAAYLLRP